MQLRAGGLAALVLAAAGVAMGQAAPAPEVIRVRRLEIVDEDGQARAQLYSDPATKGSGHLNFCQKSGQSRLHLGMGVDDDPKLYMYTGDGAVCAGLLSQPDGRPTLQFRDRSKKARLELGLTRWQGGEPEGVPYMYMLSRSGTVGFALEMQKDGAPTLQVSAGDGESLFRIPK